MASKAKAWGQKRGYAAGGKTVSDLKPPSNGRYVVTSSGKTAPAKPRKTVT